MSGISDIRLDEIMEELAYDRPIALADELKQMIAEIRRLRAENNELRASYKRVDHALRARQAMPS